MPDREKVIAEVAKQNGIRIGPEDPIFASVTAMQLGLEETLRDAEHRFKGIISEFEANVRTVERNAGKILAEHVKDYTAAMRQGLMGDIGAAGMRAQELVERVNRAQEHPNRIFWASIGLLSALGLFCSGVWFGYLTAGR